MPASPCSPSSQARSNTSTVDLLKAKPGELPVIRMALDGHKAELVDRLWAVLENAQASPDQRFCAACALAGYEPGAAEERWLSASGFITKTLLDSVKNNPSDYAQLLETLRRSGNDSWLRSPQRSGPSSVPAPSGPSPPTSWPISPATSLPYWRIC